MAPKRKDKGKGPELASKGSAQFVNEAARDRCELLKSLPCIFERGFLMERRVWNVFFANQIDTLGWDRLCHPRCEAVLPWVYEFYSNATFRDDDRVLVRGHVVDYSAAAINEMFELPTDGVAPYRALQSSVSPDDMAIVLCGPMQPEWTKKYKSGLKSTCLTREAKVWLLFINAGLLPTKHLNNISLDRMMIIYSIFKAIPFDVGMLINESIRAKVKEEKPKNLWFPTLITALCMNAGVHIAAGVFVTQVGHHITETVVEVNIKVADEPIARGEHVRSKVPGRYTRPPPSAPEPVGTAISDADYLLSFTRLQHLYLDSRADYICDVLARLAHRANVTMPEPSYRCSGNFDSEGFLLNSHGERVEIAEDDGDTDMADGEHSDEDDEAGRGTDAVDEDDDDPE